MLSFLDYHSSENIDNDREDSSTDMEAVGGDGVLIEENDGAGHGQLLDVQSMGRCQLFVV